MTLILINVAIGVFTTLVNLLFIFCFICPVQGEQIKQPLMLLLGTLVSCAAFFEMSLLLQLLAFQIFRDVWIQLISYIMFILSLSTSTTSCVWLTFFYNTQIVPVKRAVSIWIKKNVKVIIYSIWLCEKMFCVFHVIVLTAPNIIFLNRQHYLVSVNSTLTLEIQSYNLLYLQYLYFLSSAVVNSHYYFCMCVMATSNCSTIIYLCKHMRRMMINGQPVFSPQLRGQLRVTVTCVLQGSMSMFCTVWSIKKYIDQGVWAEAYTNFQGEHFTLIHLSMASTTINLCVGQAVFRQRVTDLWRRAVCCCKIRKSDQGA